MQLALAVADDVVVVVDDDGAVAAAAAVAADVQLASERARDPKHT